MSFFVLFVSTNVVHLAGRKYNDIESAYVWP